MNRSRKRFRRPVRCRARERSLQILCALECRKETDDNWQELYWAMHPATAAVRQYAVVLADGVKDKLTVIDEKIVPCMKGWTMDRLALVERNVMRQAVWEMFYGHVPPPVAINEALELVRKFSTPQAIGFVNGVLDACSREVKAPDPQQVDHD